MCRTGEVTVNASLGQNVVVRGPLQTDAGVRTGCSDGNVRQPH